MDQACRDNLAGVADPELRARLTPDYLPGCKRLVFSSDFYRAMQKPRAKLITAPIERISRGGVVTADGEEPLDVLIFATGFKTDAFMRPMEIMGPGGDTLEEAWCEGPTSYRGVALSGFPGLFMLVGPYSPTGNISIIAIAELQGDYIIRCIKRMRARRENWSPTSAAMKRVSDEMQAALKSTRWLSGCKSWYLKDGRIFLYPFPFSRFERDMTEGPDEADFERIPANYEVTA